MDIVKETKLIGNYLIGLRKDFHKYPELSMQEHRTSKEVLFLHLIDIFLT